jgi:hypothetical protein
MEIIVKQSYSHINRSIGNWDTPYGRRVKNEAHYRRLCKEQGLITFEEAKERAKNNEKGKEYKLSKEAKEIIKESKKFSDKKGGFRHQDCPKLVDKMVKVGIVKKKDAFAKYLPAHYQPKGGFHV